MVRSHDAGAEDLHHQGDQPNFADAKRQPGSSFKPFVYSAALDNGYTPSSIILDEPMSGLDPLGRMLMRDIIMEANWYSPEVAGSTRILYGGSCKPSNAAEIFGQPDVNGGLIGGAALDAESFLSLITASEAS